jgi:hypothetical protein
VGRRGGGEGGGSSAAASLWFFLAYRPSSSRQLRLKRLLSAPFFAARVPGTLKKTTEKSSLLAVGSRDSPPRRRGRGARRPPGPGGDELILWRVDPTGQFWRADASGVGRGGARAESELLRRARSWVGRGRGVATVEEGRGGEEDNHDDDDDDDEDGRRRDDADGGSAVDDFAVDNADVRAYLGTLSTSEAVEVATDCLVKGIIAGGGKHRRRRQRNAVNVEDRGDGHHSSERQRLSYELGLRRRVHAVIIES